MLLMAGLLVTSILSGTVISRTGRYKPFPIAGTAVMTVAVLLLSRLGVDSPTWVASAYMVLLGLGLGMVMQVLVLAVQNAVDYRVLGVATAGSTVFRQVGGSIGVAGFGVIFANRLGDELAARIPASAHVPTVANPAVIRASRRRFTRPLSRRSRSRCSRCSWRPPGSRWPPSC